MRLKIKCRTTFADNHSPKKYPSTKNTPNLYALSTRSTKHPLAKKSPYKTTISVSLYSPRKIKSLHSALQHSQTTWKKSQKPSQTVIPKELKYEEKIRIKKRSRPGNHLKHHKQKCPALQIFNVKRKIKNDPQTKIQKIRAYKISHWSEKNEQHNKSWKEIDLTQSQVATYLQLNKFR